MQVYTGNARDDAIGDTAGQIAFDRRVLAILAPAGNDVKAFVKLGQQLGNVVWIILQVAVHRHDNVASGVIQPGHERGGLAVVAAEVNDSDALVGSGDLVEYGCRAVAAAIVDQYQFPAPPKRQQRVFHARV